MHLAKLDENNIVTAVHIVDNDVVTIDGVESEQAGIDFLNELYKENATYKQTSYNNSIRKRYAGIGFEYHPDLDAFVSPKGYESWTLNTETCEYEAPVPYPTDGEIYIWDETTTSWVLPPVTE